MVKPVSFLGSSLEDLRCLPLEARRTAGFQLHKIQEGGHPDDWKPMSTVGRGVMECRIRDATGAYRLLYVASFPEAVYVLHVFRKATARTSSQDLVLGQRRFRDLMRYRA